MKKFKKIIIISFLWLFIVSIYSVTIVEAQEVRFRPNVEIPGYNLDQPFIGDTSNIARYIVAIYDYGLSIGAILATVMLMAAGVIWLTSGGSQDKIGQAKNMISGSIIGLVLLFGSYTILNLINPELVNFNIPEIGEIGEVKMGCCEFHIYPFTNSSPPSMSADESFMTGGINPGSNGRFTSTMIVAEQNCNELREYMGYEVYKYNHSLERGGTFKENHAPDPLRPFAGPCVSSGCCIAQFDQNTINSVFGGNYRRATFEFPTDRYTCLETAPWTEASFEGHRLSYRFENNNVCRYSNVGNCANAPDGSMCFWWNEGTWQGWIQRHIASDNFLCRRDWTCGYCYHGTCIPRQGRQNEVCGSENNLGICLSFDCGDEGENKTGRSCLGDLKCCNWSPGGYNIIY